MRDVAFASQKNADLANQHLCREMVASKKLAILRGRRFGFSGRLGDEFFGTRQDERIDAAVKTRVMY